MVRTAWFGIILAVLLTGATGALAHEEHEHAHDAMAMEQTQGETTLTGEVVDVFCYLSHGEKGLGKGHAKCAKKCIKQGLPVAIKVGDQLYLASMAHHEPANESLADYAGKQVTVHGKLMERDGQRFIAISSVEEVN